MMVCRVGEWVLSIIQGFGNFPVYSITQVCMEQGRAKVRPTPICVVHEVM